MGIALTINKILEIPKAESKYSNTRVPLRM